MVENLACGSGQPKRVSESISIGVSRALKGLAARLCEVNNK